ncbi:MAG: DNA translocase FtsK [Lentisphaerae bacterium]|jgi:S-DNA-T family DNA segregation ATPase FtsK/SpoIIIE|nr:DNA translocase FtsK [Lentisphaerota bacterium]
MSIIDLFIKETQLLLRYARLGLHKLIRTSSWHTSRENMATPCQKQTEKPEATTTPIIVSVEEPITEPAQMQPEIDGELLDKLIRKFKAKQVAREKRQLKFLREKELAERQLNPLTSTQQNNDSKQLEFNFEEIDLEEIDLEEQEAQSTASIPEPVLNQPYQIPPIKLLNLDNIVAEDNLDEMEKNAKIIQDTLDAFFIDADVIGFQSGPRITLYKVGVARGVKVESVARIANDIAMALAAQSIRILAPIPGQDCVGIEVPNAKSDIVRSGALINGENFKKHKGQIPVIIGKNIEGDDIILDLARTPHLLVAGATGSGKSVCLNNILISLLYRFSPEDLRLILVDPKIVELSVYNRLPHLVVPVITDNDLVVLALRWVISEMQRRYEILAKVGARNLESFNNRQLQEPEFDDEGNEIPAKIPFLVVIIDEMADVMLTSRQDVETALARIAQLSRAVGIHCIVATQRPSVNVITGIIKANFPSRIAFQVASQVDSRTIIDGKGAEALLGKGDMLYKPADGIRMQRLQGAFISEEEIRKVVDFCASQSNAELDFNVIKSAKQDDQRLDNDQQSEQELDSDTEELVNAAIEIILNEQKASISYLQRRLKIGYNKAATVVEILEERKIIGPQIGTAQREILIEQH